MTDTKRDLQYYRDAVASGSTAVIQRHEVLAMLNDLIDAPPAQTVVVNLGGQHSIAHPSAAPTDNTMEGYTVKKSSGRIGYEWTCPKGFTYYNFLSESEAWADARMIAAQKAQRIAPTDNTALVEAMVNERESIISALSAQPGWKDVAKARLRFIDAALASREAAASDVAILDESLNQAFVEIHAGQPPASVPVAEEPDIPELAKALFVAMQEDALHGQQARYINLVEAAAQGHIGTNAVIVGLQALAKS